MILPPIFATVFVICTGSAWVFGFVAMWYVAILVEYTAIKFLNLRDG